MTELPNLLLVDDRQQNLTALQAVLCDCSANAMTATSGNEALSLVLKHEFALVLLDVQMPNMDGFEVAELMRANVSTQNIPIIFITAINKEQHHVFKGYDVGAVDFLSKPVDPHVLCSKVKVFLELWHQKKALEQALEEKKALTEKLKDQAELDSLTKLPNRALFHDRLQQSMSTSKRSRSQGALLFIDVDHFKEVNDTHGHAVGDQLLIHVADRLVSCVRESDTVARLGGDEFTIILENIYDEIAVRTVGSKILKELARPFLLGEVEVHVSGSIGVTIFPDETCDQDELLKRTDKAMYSAKERGRNALQFYDSEINARAQERMEWEAAFGNALKNNELRLYYQPKVDVSTGAIVGVEALARWEHPERGLIFPDQFIPMAERTGLIVPMGEWVLREACFQAQEWMKSGIGPIEMSVNLSAEQFTGDLMSVVTSSIESAGIPPEILELEITESKVMDNLTDSIVTMEELRRLGVHISIDDFGTGYSSLALLKYYPIQTLKIDKSFIKDLAVNSNDSAIVLAIIAMAHELSLSVTAEGVETAEQLQFLRNGDCDQVQGYYFSRPVPAEQCAVLLKDKNCFKL